MGQTIDELKAYILKLKQGHDEAAHALILATEKASRAAAVLGVPESVREIERLGRERDLLLVALENTVPVLEAHEARAWADKVKSNPRTSAEDFGAANASVRAASKLCRQTPVILNAVKEALTKVRGCKG